jgi:inhibitor of cysteine peptidase
MADTTLTNADAGRTVAVNSGDQIVVRLAENPSTAYLWKVEQLNTRVLELVSDEHELAAGSGIGGGGERKLVFRANEPGTSPLRLKSVRQWEPDNPSSIFSVTIEVHA